MVIGMDGSGITVYIGMQDNGLARIQGANRTFVTGADVFDVAYNGTAVVWSDAFYSDRPPHSV